LSSIFYPLPSRRKVVLPETNPEAIKRIEAALSAGLSFFLSC
jgi:hypothetical protein